MVEDDKPPVAAGRPAAVSRGRAVLLTAAAFAVGLLLGAAVLGADGPARRTDAAPIPTPTAGPSPTPTPTATGGATIRVPGPCLQAAEQADEAYALVEEGVVAARNLDARALADLVDRAQRSRPEVQALLDACRAEAAGAPPAPAPS